MSLYSISLKKLLQLCNADNAMLVSKLREEIRRDIKNKTSPSSGGGDFHILFWRDAKDYALYNKDLHVSTEDRIDKDWRKKRLYPLLRDGFLGWWKFEKLKTNEDIKKFDEEVHNHYQIGDFNITLKVDNLLGVKFGDHVKVVYPYFSEFPELNEEWARVGLWLMKKALSKFDVDEFVILDVIRSIGYSNLSLVETGKEQQKFNKRIVEILRIWGGLKLNYPDY